VQRETNVTCIFISTEKYFQDSRFNLPSVSKISEKCISKLSSKHVKVAVLNIKIPLPVGVRQGLLLRHLALTSNVSKAVKHFGRGGMVFPGKEA
jgi:hypothetical protein